MKIGLLAYSGCVASGLFAFAELLEVANKRAGKRCFETKWIGVNQQNVAISTGGKKTITDIHVEGTLLDDDLEAILIPGFWTNHQQHVEQALNAYQPIVTSLKQLPAHTEIWSYCTAVCILAATGYLDQQPATATWWLADYAQSHSPKVAWNFSQTYVFHNRFATASGLNGYLPIAQALIEKNCGKEVLRDIIDLMILPKPETSAQPFKQIKLMTLEDKLLRTIFMWVEQTPASELNIKALAAELNQTERTLTRKVKIATKLSCASFMRLIKLHQASEYLIYSRKPINIISDILGFSDDAAFRRTFKKVSSFTPSEYRQAFQR